MLYDVVATACITETLSTALLGALVECAYDSLARQTMQSILRDEVKHSRLGWMFLAGWASRNVSMHRIGPYLPNMLDSTVQSELFTTDPMPDPATTELTGLGALDRPSLRRVVREALELVVLPGLEQLGIDGSSGRHWLRQRDADQCRYAGELRARRCRGRCCCTRRADSPDRFLR